MTATTTRAQRQSWLSDARVGATITGPDSASIVVPHATGTPTPAVAPRSLNREAREAAEHALLADGATRSHGAGNRAVPEPADPNRTCFERDHDRIVHSAAFRRLAGKTQVHVHPADHQRTRLTHALEVAQVAVGIARPAGLNATLAEAIALGHDCGHGPGGHSSEDAFDIYAADLGPDGFDHATWGADVTLAPLNLCAETLDGIRNHSWSRPAPATPEGAVVAIADRVAYLAHDLEDAISAGILPPDAFPADLAAALGPDRRTQIATLVAATVDTINTTGLVALPDDLAAAVNAFRSFNYQRIYARPASRDQNTRVVAVLRALVDHFAHRPELTGQPVTANPVRDAVAYVAGMTDRYAFAYAVNHLGWNPARLPEGIDIA